MGPILDNREHLGDIPQHLLLQRQVRHHPLQGAFSFSSSFCRCTWSSFNPPYSFRHR